MRGEGLVRGGRDVRIHVSQNQRGGTLSENSIWFIEYVWGSVVSTG